MKWIKIKNNDDNVVKLFIGRIQENCMKCKCKSPILHLSLGNGFAAQYNAASIESMAAFAAGVSAYVCQQNLWILWFVLNDYTKTLI